MVGAMPLVCWLAHRAWKAQPAEAGGLERDLRPLLAVAFQAPGQPRGACKNLGFLVAISSLSSALALACRGGSRPRSGSQTVGLKLPGWQSQSELSERIALSLGLWRRSSPLSQLPGRPGHPRVAWPPFKDQRSARLCTRARTPARAPLANIS